MALDPSIALAYRPPQVNVDVPNPIQQFGQILSLRNMMQQGQLGQLGLQSKMLELDQLRRQMQEQQDYADAMKKYAEGAGSTTAPAGTAPVQTAPLVPPVTPSAPPMTAPYTPVAPFTPAADASPASLSALMTPQTPAPAAAPVAQAPAMGKLALSRMGGMNAAQFIARFPLTGLSRIKDAFALDTAEAEAGIKQHDLYFKKADAMGRYAQAVKDSKDPAAQFTSSLMEAAANGDLDPAVARQMIADGYEKHKNDIDAFIVKAQNGKDYAETQAKNLAALQDKRKLAIGDIANVNNQDDFTKFLARYPELQPVLGDAFSPDVKDAFRFSPTDEKDIPKARMDAAVAATGILEPARAKGQAEFDAALAKYPQYIQDRFRDAKTPLEVRQLALTPEQAATTGRTIYQQGLQQENKLRDDYVAQTKEFQLVRDAYGRVQSALAGPAGGIRDLGLVYGYMKLVDPGSIVREGQAATVENASGVPDWVRNLYNKLMSGERLPDATRNQLTQHVDQLYGQATKDHEKVADQFRDMAKRQNLDPRNVIVDFGTTAQRKTDEEKTPSYQTIEKTGAAPGGRVTGAITIAPPGKIKVTSPEGDDYWADAGQWPTLEKRHFTRTNK